MENKIKYDEILDNAQIAIFTTDKAGFVTYSNQAARALLGLDETRIAAQITEILPALGQQVMECLGTGGSGPICRYCMEISV